MKVMCLCNDLDLNMPDDLLRMWLAKGLPLTLLDVLFFSAKGVLNPQLEEILKEREAFLAMMGDKSP